MEKILAVDLYIKRGNKSQVIKFSDAKERNFAKDIKRNGGCDGMREIKFRGRRKNSSEWCYGAFLAIPKLCSYIYDVQPDGQATRYLVDEDTVGQFTGLYDTDGREIYEGDVLGNKYTSQYKFANAVVEWGVDGWLADCFSLREFLKLHTCIVVGNIYDNSELLPELPEEDDARD